MEFLNDIGGISVIIHDFFNSLGTIIITIVTLHYLFIIKFRKILLNKEKSAESSFKDVKRSYKELIGNDINRSKKDLILHTKEINNRESTLFSSDISSVSKNSNNPKSANCSSTILVPTKETSINYSVNT